MKRKLQILFLLITIALAGIISLQVYWSVNVYNANKNKFDADVDIAMQRAMDDCKKDYFDSIRVVLVKRLSDTVIKIRIDTSHEADTVHKQLIIYFKNKSGSGIIVKAAPITSSHHETISEMVPEGYHMTSNQYDYYRAMIKHKNATIPEVLTEASFYVPSLMNQLQMLLGMDDIVGHWDETQAFVKAHSNIPQDSIFARGMQKGYGIYALPVNYKQADSIRLRTYLKSELSKIHIHPNFDFYFSLNHTQPHKLSSYYSETNEYNYRYHGFVFLGVTGRPFYARAVFKNPLFAVLGKMLIPLLSSLLLILFIGYCFNYIIRLVIHQKKLAELKDDFINNMTHELKTPIATINVAIEALQKFNALNDPEKTQRYLQVSRVELSKLNNLVTKVLNIAAFENKEIDLVEENINVDELINDIISTQKTRSNKEVDFTYRNPGNIKTIYADMLHFGNVLSNIIDNAIKYSKEPVKVEIACLKQDGNAVFSIKDNGIGIPQDHIKLVFDKFHRVPTGNVHNVKGTGLGLSYARYIANAHGGDISVKSEINTGSEFIVSIPLKNG